MAAELSDGIRIRARNAVARIIVLRCVRAAGPPTARIFRIEKMSMSPTRRVQQVSIRGRFH
jgi:hypothetical protein